MGFSRNLSLQLGRKLDHFIGVSGLPYDYSAWDKFKDLIRSSMRGSPGWTDVSHSVADGGSKGTFRASSDQDADSSYEFLTSNPLLFGNTLEVFHYDVSVNPPELLRCNVPMLAQTNGFAPLVAFHPRFSAAIPRMAPIMPQAVPAMVPQLRMAPMQQPSSWASENYGLAPTAPLTMTPTFTEYMPAHCGYQPMPISADHYSVQMRTPVYTTAPNGMRVNVSQGAVLTERRGIHVANLKFTMTRQEFNDLLKDSGVSPTRLDFPMDNNNGRNLGYATALFATMDQAQQAVRLLHGRSVKGMNLRAKLDKETTSIEPTVANGSTPRRVRCQRAVTVGPH